MVLITAPLAAVCHGYVARDMSGSAAGMPFLRGTTSYKISQGLQHTNPDFRQRDRHKYNTHRYLYIIVNTPSSIYIEY